MHYLSKLPSWIYLVLLFSFLSILGSIPNWSTTGEFFSKFAAIGNLVVGPFFLMPLIYFRLQGERDADLLLEGFVFSFIVPSVTFMFLALFFGSPGIDTGLNVLDDPLTSWVYHFGNVDFRLIRTQVGIPLATLICASFAVFFGDVSKRIRLIVFVFLIITIYLLLVTGSVGSSIAVLAGIVAILVVARRYISVKRHLVALTICISLAMVGWGLLPKGIKDYSNIRYEERFSGDSIKISDRTERWHLSLEYLLDNPEGQGWSLYVAKIRKYPHNDYLSYGIAFGFICGLLYLFVPAKIIISMITPKVPIKDPAQITILLAGIGVVTAFMINSFSDHLTANRWYFNVVWSMIWYCFFSSRANVVAYNK
jgi:O-Antigen ligase.